MGQILHKKQSRQITRRVLFEASTGLTEGQAVFYNSDYGTAEDTEGQRDKRVELPTATNAHQFAGLVDGTVLGKTGGQWIDVNEPGSICVGYANIETVVDQTLLCAELASGTLKGLGTGPVVARALETDASTDTTAGPVLVQVLPALRVPPYSIAAPSSTVNGFSKNIWATCPWDAGLNDPGLLHTFFDDYKSAHPITGTSTDEVKEWIQTEVTSGLTGNVAEAGGILRVSSEASASANDGLTVMYRATDWVPAAGKRLWFEARVRMVNVSTTGSEDQFFVGLANTITSALPSGVVDDTVDKIGFYRHDGSTVLTLEFITAKTTVQAATAAAATVADSTWINLGFVADLTTITPYVNGVAGTAHATALSLPTAATGLGILYAAVSEGTTTGNLDVDWVRVAQLR